MIVLDTNVVSELMRRLPADRVVSWLDAQPAVELHVTAVTVGELWYGIERLPVGSRRRALADALATVLDEDFRDRVVPFDRASAEQYGALAADRDDRGRPIGHEDAQIASICRTRGATLATRNVRDFEHTGIAVVDPWADPLPI